MTTRIAITLGILLLGLITACTPTVSGPESTAVPMPTPTTFLFFAQTEELTTTNASPEAERTGVPTIASLFVPLSTYTPSPTYTPMPTRTPLRPDFSVPDVITKTIYGDTLNDNWLILEDTGSMFDTANESPVYRGQKSISFTPTMDFGSLYFAVRPETDTAYPSSEVIGLDFRLNSGSETLQLDQLALAIIGSNDHHFWDAGDNSVEFPAGETFSETRLYYLGLNRAIPPNTWVEVYLPFDSLIYDPEYQYVTGFYLKNDAGFNNTIYLDDINFVMVDSVATPIPTLQATPAATGTLAPGETPLAETPAAETPGEIAATAVPTAAACEVNPPSAWIPYQIQSGDSLANLAYNAGASLDSILEANCLTANSVLSVGKQIWLPALPSTPTPSS